jgi:5'-methylthioadenosine phosphorylase
MSPVNISLITDYDTGVDDVPPVSHQEVIKVFTDNNQKLRKLLYRFIELVNVDEPGTFHGMLSTARHG